MKHGVR